MKRITIKEVIRADLRERLREIEILADPLSLELIKRVCRKRQRYAEHKLVHD